MFSQIHRSLADDDRAIDEVPIRLVVALIVGVVMLGIVMQILRGIDTFDSDTEVDVEFESAESDLSADDDTDLFSVYVVDADGNNATDARGIAMAGDARMGAAIVEHTGEDSNEATFTFEEENVRPAPDLAVGTDEFEVQPPTGSLKSQEP